MSSSGEPPRTTNQPPSSPPSLISSLPNELITEILARVPRRYYPIVTCVCKKFADLVRSPDIHKQRSFLGLDSLYIGFVVKTTPPTPKWFTLCNNLFTYIDLAYPPNLNCSFVFAIGPEIIFLGDNKVAPSTYFIFDSRSRTFREGASMLMEQWYGSIGYLGDDDAFLAESFDLKKKIWEFVPKREKVISWICPASVTLDKKVYTLTRLLGVIGYDPRANSREIIQWNVSDKWWRTGVCVIQNVIYVYFVENGLMWFDTKAEMWKSVVGLSDMKKVRSVGMAEYYGKMAFLWRENVSEETQEIWCRMIALDKSEVGIRGNAELAQLLGTVPRSYRLRYCLPVSD